MKRSSLWFTAYRAALNELPTESRALIEKHDELHSAWGKDGYPSPAPISLKPAREAVYADPLAELVMELRCHGNDAFFEEWKADKAEGKA